ncbi:hypothetical protein Tco_0018447 [Tanacetum coccineum]
MPRECLKIIESKSKVRQSRSKAVIAKVSTSSSTLAVSSDVAELKDMVRALILDKKNQTPAPAPVKAVEQSCVTCGGGHSYQNCPATDGNVYRDNIQEYVSQAAAVNYNQGNASYRPQMVANQIRPPGFPPINQPPTFQAPPYQAPAPAPPAPGVSKSDFDNYVKANDAMENEPEVTKDTVQPSHRDIQLGGPTNDPNYVYLEELLSVTNLKKKMTDKYCPRGEIKKLEVEMWNRKVKGTDVVSYNQRCQELALMCARMFPEESDKIERYVGGLPDMIHGSVMASKPKTMQDVIEFATELMDKKIRTFVERQSENKRKQDDNQQQQ